MLAIIFVNTTAAFYILPTAFLILLPVSVEVWYLFWG